MPSQYDGAVYNFHDGRGTRASDTSASLDQRASAQQSHQVVHPGAGVGRVSQLTGGTPRDPERDSRQHAGGQPLPPGSATPSSPLRPVSSTAPPPPNRSAYALSMLQHTKQQMDATSALPPPPHIHVAGPIGDRTTRHAQEYRPYRRRRSSASPRDGTVRAMPNGHLPQQSL